MRASGSKNLCSALPDFCAAAMAQDKIGPGAPAVTSNQVGRDAVERLADRAALRFEHGQIMMIVGRRVAADVADRNLEATELDQQVVVQKHRIDCQ
jgi:hypothetical protein